MDFQLGLVDQNECFIFKNGFKGCGLILDWNGLGWVICDLGSDSILIFLVFV